MSQQDKKPISRLPRSREGKILAVALGLALLVGGGLGVQAMTGSNAYEHMKLAGYGGWHRGGGKRFSDMTDTEINDRDDRDFRVHHSGQHIPRSPGAGGLCSRGHHHHLASG